MEIKDLVNDTNTDVEITISKPKKDDDDYTTRVYLELGYDSEKYKLRISKMADGEHVGSFTFEIENKERAFDLLDAFVLLYKEELK